MKLTYGLLSMNTSGITRLWENAHPMTNTVGRNISLAENFVMMEDFARQAESLNKEWKPAWWALVAIGFGFILAPIASLVFTKQISHTLLLTAIWGGAATFSLVFALSAFIDYLANRRMKKRDPHIKRLEAFEDFLREFNNWRLQNPDAFERALSLSASDVQEMTVSVLRELAFTIDGIEHPAKKAQLRDMFNRDYDLAVRGGIIPPDSYADYFLKEPSPPAGWD